MVGQAGAWGRIKYGDVDKAGNMVITPRFERAKDFADGLALVKESGKAFYIDPSGKPVLQPGADRAWPYSQGLAVVKLGGRYGYMDKGGKIVIAAQFTFAQAFRNGLASVGLPKSEWGPATSAYIQVDGGVVWRAPR